MGREILYSEYKQSWKHEFTVLRHKIERLHAKEHILLHYCLIFLHNP